MALTDDIRLLSQLPLFHGMGEEPLRLIAFGADRRHVSPGQTLFRENRRPNAPMSSPTAASSSPP